MGCAGLAFFLKDLPREIIDEERKKSSAKYRARYEMKKREWKRKERLYREEIRVRMEEDMDAETSVDEGEWKEVEGQDEA